jgi:hypothetical protein
LFLFVIPDQHCLSCDLFLKRVLSSRHPQRDISLAAPNREPRERRSEFIPARTDPHTNLTFQQTTLSFSTYGISFFSTPTYAFYTLLFSHSPPAPVITMSNDRYRYSREERIRLRDQRFLEDHFEDIPINDDPLPTMTRLPSSVPGADCDLDESTYDMLSDTATDDDAATTESLGCDRSDLGDNEPSHTHASQEDESESDAETTEDESNDKEVREADRFIMPSPSSSIVSRLTERNSAQSSVFAPVPNSDERSSQNMEDHYLNSDLDSLLIKKGTDISQLSNEDKNDDFKDKDDKDQLIINKMRNIVSQMTSLSRQYVLGFVTFIVVAIVTTYLTTTIQNFLSSTLSKQQRQVVSQDHSQFLVENFPSLASSASAGSSSSKLSTPTDVAKDTSLSSYLLSSLLSPNSHIPADSSATTKHGAVKEVNPSPLSVPKRFQSVSQDDKPPTYLNVNPSGLKIGTEEKKDEYYIYLETGNVVPRNEAKKWRKGNRLGPYKQLQGDDKKKFNLRFDYAQNEFVFSDSATFRGSLEILVRPRGPGSLLKGHLPSGKSSLEWVPRYAIEDIKAINQVEGKMVFDIIFVLPAEHAFQLADITITRQSDPWTAVARRYFTGALTTYVEPLGMLGHKNMVRNVERINEMIEEINDATERAIDRAQDSAAEVVTAFQLRAKETAAQSRNAIGDAIANVRRHKALMLAETRKALASAQKQVKDAGRALQKKKTGKKAAGSNEEGRRRPILMKWEL